MSNEQTLRDIVRGAGTIENNLSEDTIAELRRLDRRGSELVATLNLPAPPTIRELLRLDYGDRESSRILDSDGDFEQEDAELKRIEKAINGEGTEDLTVAEVGMMSLSTLRHSGRCSDSEFVLMSLEPPKRQREFVEHRANVPVGAVQSPSESYSKQMANWALGGKRPA